MRKSPYASAPVTGLAVLGGIAGDPYLGCRFHGHIDASLIQVAAKYCDVISYNVYEEPNGRLNQYRGKVDMPFIIGEFGVTSDLGQMPWRGQIYTEEEGARLRPLERWLGTMMPDVQWRVARGSPLDGALWLAQEGRPACPAI